MTTLLLVVDPQNDFCEGGALPVEGGHAVVRSIRRLLAANRYDLYAVSQDWHSPEGSNGGHFDEWPVHCVAGTPGADLAPGIELGDFDAVFRKGYGTPAYSAFEGHEASYPHAPASPIFAPTLGNWALDHAVSKIDVVGLASDYCVVATARDSVKYGFRTDVLWTFTAPVDRKSGLYRSQRAFAEVLVK